MWSGLKIRFLTLNDRIIALVLKRKSSKFTCNSFVYLLFSLIEQTLPHNPNGVRFEF